jgi:hypothetical protein
MVYDHTRKGNPHVTLSRLTEFARAGETSGMPFNGPKVLVPLRPGDVRMIATPRTEEGYGSIHT